MTTAVQPDIELAVVNYLRTIPALIAAPPTGLGVTIGTELPTHPVWPMLVVMLQDEADDYPGWLTHPRLQVDAWGATNKKQARDVAATFKAAFFDIAGIRSDGTANAIVSFPEVLSGPRWIPDSPAPGIPARPRYITDVRLTSHPQPS